MPKSGAIYMLSSAYKDGTSTVTRRPSGDSRTLDVFGVLLLAVPAFWASASLAASNLASLPRIERLIAVSFALWAVFVGICYLVARISGHRRGSAYAVFAFSILVVGSGACLETYRDLAVDWPCGGCGRPCFRPHEEAGVEPMDPIIGGRTRGGFACGPSFEPR